MPLKAAKVWFKAISLASDFNRNLDLILGGAWLTKFRSLCIAKTPDYCRSKGVRLSGYNVLGARINIRSGDS